jgi:hypothetical protein
MLPKLPLIAFLLVLPTLVFWLFVLLYYLGVREPLAYTFGRFGTGRAGMIAVIVLNVGLPLLAFAVNAVALKEQKNKHALNIAITMTAFLLIAMAVLYLGR